MYPRHLSHGILGAALLCCPALARAQCPDGTPPPCNRPAAPAARVALDENLIAVFPFRITGTGQDASALREGAMDLLSMALDEQAGLRVVPSRTLVARARTFTDASSVDDAATIARAVGAGRMVLGNAIIAGGQLRARAEVFDVATRRTAGSVEARGVAADPAPVIDSLSFGVGRALLASGDIAHRSIAEFATTSPAALRLYLAGEGLSRRGRWQDAADSLIAALRIDSAFALAMFRLRIVNAFGSTIQPYDAGELVESAMRTIRRLPRRQADLLQASYALEAGNARDGITRADDLLRRYPDDPDATFEAGEIFYHLGIAFGESPQRALDAFLRTIALDSARVEPYGHAAELRMMLGDSAGALALARRGVAVAPSSRVHRATLIAARAIVLHEDPRALADELARTDQLGDLNRSAYECWRMLSADAPRALALAGRFYELNAARGTPAQRAGGWLGLAEVRLVQGRFADVQTALEEGRRLDPADAGFARVGLLSALMQRRDVGPADSLVRGRTATPGIQTLGLLGWSAAQRRRPDQVEEIVMALRAIAQREPRMEQHVDAVEATVRGLAALERGDSAAALRLLPGAAGVLPFTLSASIRTQDVMGWGILALARLEAERGQAEQALSRLSFFTFATGVVPARLMADSLRARLESRPRP
jgi:tetratricopeptide (TPR) repeat protein